MKSQRDKFNLILQEVARSGRQWDDVIPLAAIADDGFTDLNVKSPLFGDMAWKASIESVGGQFVLQGAWQMDVPRQCGRCNVEFALNMSGNVAVTYAIGQSKSEEEQAELQLTGDESEMLENGELNVLEVLREHFWLAWQPLAVCSESCKGLCLQCGVDLNKGECDCHLKKKDNAFAALKGLKFDA